MNEWIDALGFRVAALNWFVRATLLGSDDLVHELTEEGGMRDPARDAADPRGLDRDF